MAEVTKSVKEAKQTTKKAAEKADVVVDDNSKDAQPETTDQKDSAADKGILADATKNNE